MSEPRRLGDIMEEYILNSDDDFAVGLRKLLREHKSDLFGLNEKVKQDKKGRKDDK